VSINLDAPVDSRSYRVDFSLFEELAPDHRPKFGLSESIAQLVEALSGRSFDGDFRNSELIRLNVLQEHVRSGRLTTDLRWAQERE